MFEPIDLTEEQAELVNRLIQAYPAGLTYNEGRAAHAFAAPLAESGFLTAHTAEQVPELEPGQITYRLKDEYAEQVRETSEQRAELAVWN